MQTLVYQRQKPEEGEATECRLCKHSGCILNTDYISQVTHSLFTEEVGSSDV